MIRAALVGVVLALLITPAEPGGWDWALDYWHKIVPARKAAPIVVAPLPAMGTPATIPPLNDPPPWPLWPSPPIYDPSAEPLWPPGAAPPEPVPVPKPRPKVEKKSTKPEKRTKATIEGTWAD